MGNVIVLAVLLVIVFLAARSLYRDKKSGKACSGCSGCSGCAQGCQSNQDSALNRNCDSKGVAERK